jgi:hypothetical protein
MLAALQFNTTITLGSILIGTIILALGGIHTVRTNYGNWWKQAYDEQKARADELEEQFREQRRLKHDARNELAAQRLKTDLTTLVTPIQEIMVALERMSQTQERQTHLLDVLAERIGGNNNGEQTPAA